MGKILVVSFDDDEKAILQEILCLLEKRGEFSILHTVTSNKRLEFENLVIIPNERMVKVKDAPIELILNLKFFIYWQKVQDKCFLRSKFMLKCGMHLIMEPRIM